MSSCRACSSFPRIIAVAPASLGLDHGVRAEMLYSAADAVITWFPSITLWMLSALSSISSIKKGYYLLLSAITFKTRLDRFASGSFLSVHACIIPRRIRDSRFSPSSLRSECFNNLSVTCQDQKGPHSGTPTHFKSRAVIRDEKFKAYSTNTAWQIWPQSWSVSSSSPRSDVHKHIARRNPEEEYSTQDPSTLDLL